MDMASGKFTRPVIRGSSKSMEMESHHAPHNHVRAKETRELMPEDRAVASVWKRSFAAPGTGSGAEPGVRHSLHRGGRGICIVGRSNLALYPGLRYEASSNNDGAEM